jgi:diguanylate cyclase (GGDEF)-like protein/PAS domain S-box-containing protein
MGLPDMDGGGLAISFRNALRTVPTCLAWGAAWIGLTYVALYHDADGARLPSIQGGGLLLAALVALLVSIRRHREQPRQLSQQRAELRALSQFRESVIDNASIWINVLDPGARVTVWNKAAEEISGYRRDEVLNNLSIWEWLYPDPDYRATVVNAAAAILDKGIEVRGFESRIRTRRGEEKTISWSSRRFFGEKGEMVGSIAIGEDITARKRAEEALRERERQLATLMANLPGMAYRCLNDPNWTMKFVSSGCWSLTGYAPEALVDNGEVSYGDLVHPEDRERIWIEVQQAILAGRPFALEYRLIRRSGDEIWVWEQGRAVHIDERELIEGIIIDITDRKAMEQELAWLATRDALTGLYNRRELMQQFQEAVLRGAGGPRPLAVVLLDVDHFKRVNDSFGHATGDEVLRRIGELLRTNVRQTDSAARYGGEELVVVLPAMASAEALEAAERLRTLVAAQRIAAGDGRTLAITVSVGVAVFPEHGKTPEELLESADRALYRAKHAGRDCVVLASLSPPQIPSGEAAT